MKFAPVLPAHLYPQLDWGTYHLIQAHTLEDQPETIEWARQLAHPRSQHHVILDNGMIELGEADVDKLTAAAQVIRPNEIISPDVAFDSDVTCDLFQEHAPDLSMFCDSLMVVPQGQSLFEWCDCADRLAHYAAELNVPIVYGISRLLNTFDITMELGQSTRTYALRWLHTYMLHHDFWHQVHLLGIDAELFKAAAECQHQIVRGIDSTVAFAKALQGNRIGALTKKVEIPERGWTINPTNALICLAEINIANTRYCLGELT